MVLAGQALISQLNGSDEVARNYDSASNLEHLLNLAAGALLATTGRPGSVLLSAVIGGVLIYLGIAAISVLGNPQSWGIVGGVLAMQAGAAFIALAVSRRRQLLPQPTAVSGGAG